MDHKVQKAVNNGLLDEIMGVGEKRVRFLARGEYNINYRVTQENADRVLRLNTGSQIPVENQIRYEFLSLQAIHASGVTPRVYAYDISQRELPYDWLLMDFEEGRPLSYETDAQIAIQLLARVHALPVPEKSHFLREDDLLSARLSEGEGLLTNVWDSPHVDRSTKEIFSSMRDSLRSGLDEGAIFRENPVLSINNTELNSHNFIIGEERSCVIDWEKPVLSDPVQDLVHFWSPTSTLWKTRSVFTEGEKEELLRHYEDIAGHDPLRREKIRIYTPYLYWRAFTWCAFALHEYLSSPREIKNEDTLQTIRRYLQPDFMKEVWKIA